MPLDHDIRPGQREPGPQPDPLLHEGRAGAARKWAVTGFIVAMLLLTMYGITGYRAEQRSDDAPAASSAPPTQPLPGGRTTADAPASPPAARPGGG